MLAGEWFLCFQPTYEELKRDWKMRLKSRDDWFSAYLRGIETPVRA